jgi:hypothetical protein
MAGRRLSDMPTVRIDVAELKKFARQADETVRRGGALDPALTANMPTDDLDSVEVPLGELDDAPAPAKDENNDPLLDRVPILVASREDLVWFGLEEGAQALLSHIDGQATVREILERAGVPREQALVLLQELDSHRVVAFE